MNDTEETFQQTVAGYQLFGEPLRKWSTDRKNAADSMGVLWPMIGDARWATWEETGRYPGMKKDVAIILWLLSLKPASELSKDEVKSRTWTPDKAFNNPSGAVEEAMRWIDEQSWGDMSHPQFFEAANVALSIVAGVAASQFIISSEDGADEKKMASSTPQDGLV